MFSSCRRYAARGLALVTFVVLTAMNSCEGRNTAPAVPFTGKQLPGALLAMLPPLPQGRQASYTEDRVRLGAQTYDRSANTDVSGTSLRFSAGAGSLEWAIWSLDAAACTPVNLDIHLSATAGECVYLAVANYAAGRWAPT